jgi:hypothetical protein
MSLNIKDEEVHRLARELARLTKESMTTAVREAVRERLERVRGKPNEQGATSFEDRAEVRAFVEEAVSLRGPWRTVVRRKRIA